MHQREFVPICTGTAVRYARIPMAASPITPAFFARRLVQVMSSAAIRSGRPSRMLPPACTLASKPGHTGKSRDFYIAVSRGATTVTARQGSRGVCSAFLKAERLLRRVTALPNSTPSRAPHLTPHTPESRALEGLNGRLEGNISLRGYCLN